MLCQKCGKNQANTRVKTIVNGKLTEYSLCGECAAEMGYGSFISHLNFGNILGSFFDDFKGVGDVERCPECGASFDEIMHSGNVGCGKCYQIFYNRLLPTIQRIHGTTAHKGKAPGKSALAIPEQKKQITVSPIEPLEAKKLQLKSAIEEQRFEDAAKLRDEIKALEAGKEEGKI